MSRLELLRPFIFIVTFLTVAAAGQAQLPFDRVRVQILNNQFKLASELLDSCRNANFHQDSAFYYRALLKIREGDVKEARKYCSSLQRSYPEFYEVHFLYGLILFNQEHLPQSIDEFDAVLKHNPKHIKALYNRALAYGLVDDYNEAVDGLSKCIELDPRFAMAYYSRAYWHEFTSNFAEAAKDYEEAIRLDPANFDAYLGLAYAYRNLKDDAKACETVQKAIEAGSQIAEELRPTFCK